MKIIYTSDLHGIEGLYSQLFQLAVNWRADAIIVGGDLLPKHGSFSTSVEDQRDFIIHFMKPRLEGIHGKLPGLEVYATMGNDDWLINMPCLACTEISFFAPQNPPPVPDLDNIPDRPI